VPYRSKEVKNVQTLSESITTFSQKAHARLVTKWFGREDGQAMAEYGLILALVAVVVVAALAYLGYTIFGKTNDVSSNLGGGSGAPSMAKP
jgi:pilus assembly protein Flp/PilA